jgi:hypothetical protein
MKLKPLLEFDKRQALAFQQGLLDHPDVEDAELQKLGLPDDVILKVTLTDSDVAWFVSIWDMLDGGDHALATVKRWDDHERGIVATQGSSAQVNISTDPTEAAAEIVTAIHGVFP